MNTKPVNEKNEFGIFMSEKKMISLDDISANNFNSSYLNIEIYPVSVDEEYRIAWMKEHVVGSSGGGFDSRFNKHLSFDNKDKVNLLIKKLPRCV